MNRPTSPPPPRDPPGAPPPPLVVGAHVHPEGLLHVPFVHLPEEAGEPGDLRLLGMAEGRGARRGMAPRRGPSRSPPPTGPGARGPSRTRTGRRGRGGRSRRSGPRRERRSGSAAPREGGRGPARRGPSGSGSAGPCGRRGRPANTGGRPSTTRGRAEGPPRGRQTAASAAALPRAPFIRPAALPRDAMDFALTETHDMTRRMVRDFGERGILPQSLEFDERQDFPAGWV